MGTTAAGTSTPVTIELWATRTPRRLVPNLRLPRLDHGQAVHELVHGTDLNTDRVEWGQTNGQNPIVDYTYAPLLPAHQVPHPHGDEPAPAPAAPPRHLALRARFATAPTSARPRHLRHHQQPGQLNDVNDALGLSPYNDNAPSATYDEVRIWNGALPEWAREASTTRGPTT